MADIEFVVFTYREMMQLVLTYTHRKRPIISLPWFVGGMQGWLLEKLPENILTLTRDQVCGRFVLSLLATLLVLTFSIRLQPQ